MSLMTLHCPECREDRLFERPHATAPRPAGPHTAPERRDPGQPHEPAECPDGGHSYGECAELACVECGAALFAGHALPIMVGAPEHTRSRRHPPGRAA